VNRRLTERGRERRRQLMDFAAARFAENGFHPTSVAEIVQGVGELRADSLDQREIEEELFVEILREAQQDLRRRQQSAIADEDDPVRRIELGIRASLAWFEQHRHLFNLFQFAVTEERFAVAMRRGQEVAVADAVRHVKEGIVEGKIRDADPTVLAHAILGVTSQLARELVHHKGESAEEIADAAVAFCLEGLVP